MSYKILKYFGVALVVILAIYKITTIGYGITVTNEILYGILMSLIILSLVGLVPTRVHSLPAGIGIVLSVLNSPLVHHYALALGPFIGALFIIGFGLQFVGGFLSGE